MAAVASTPLGSVLVCPVCRNHIDIAELTCSTCGIEYPKAAGIPVLLAPDHDWRSNLLAFEARVIREERAAQSPPTGSAKLIGLLKKIAPEQRLWSNRSRRAISAALETARRDDEHLIVNLGAGFERIFQEAFASVPEVVRIGLPHSGKVDVVADVMALPLEDDSVALFTSSSVLEHVIDPDSGVEEMSRVVCEGGLVYAEIPFLRSYHMAPHDYQRYTIVGIERLFERHGFELVDKGITSGPFTAWALMIHDSSCALVRPLGSMATTLVSLVMSVLTQPIKYLDRLVEDSPYAEFQACNFYYVGRRASA